MSERGIFITFEGGEGSGKSTQIRLLARTLEAHGMTVRILREPGGTAPGEAVRRILLDPQHVGLDARAELLLYEAARAQLVAEIIEPALEAGEVVLCDRFFDSTTAYQGYGRGLPVEQIVALNMMATGGLVPDRTLLLDVDPGVGVGRATTGGADRLEGESAAFHESVREGFRALAAQEPERVRLIDADGSVEAVAEKVVSALSGLIDLPADPGL